MLRACHRVLRPGGRMAATVIHTRAGLTPEEGARAAALGPGEVLADAPPAELFGQAGFGVTADEDVTAAFRRTCSALLAARRELEDELRPLEGDAVYEDELGKKVGMLEGIDAGLLRRSLLAASALA